MTTANALWNPWANDRNTLALFRRRCRLEAEEMTCAAQAAEILASTIEVGESLLDAGCGGGYYWHSLQSRGVDVRYHGLDYTPQMIELARTEMCQHGGLPESAFRLGAIEDLDEPFDNVLCFNVLTNSPHYALPLERMLRCARKRVLLRESLAERLVVTYQPDPYLDEGKRDLHVYHNTYPIDEVSDFMAGFGFAVRRIVDRRTNDGTELVVGVPHAWRILLAERS